MGVQSILAPWYAPGVPCYGDAEQPHVAVARVRGGHQCHLLLAGWIAVRCRWPRRYACGVPSLPSSLAVLSGLALTCSQWTAVRGCWPRRYAWGVPSYSLRCIHLASLHPSISVAASVAPSCALQNTKHDRTTAMLLWCDPAKIHGHASNPCRAAVSRFRLSSHFGLGAPDPGQRVPELLRGTPLLHIQVGTPLLHIQVGFWDLFFFHRPSFLPLDPCQAR